MFWYTDNTISRLRPAEYIYTYRIGRILAVYNLEIRQNIISMAISINAESEICKDMISKTDKNVYS